PRHRRKSPRSAAQQTDPSAGGPMRGVRLVIFNRIWGLHLHDLSCKILDALSSMKQLLLLLLIAAASSFGVAEKRVVDIDVAQSMTHYGPWQDDVKEALSNILFEGRGPDAKLWQSTGNPEVLKRYRANVAVVMLRFGSVPSSDFPYFSTAEVGN